MNHIFYQTKTYFSNTGDVLINNALISVLRNYGIIHANCCSDVPEEFLRNIGLKAEERIACENEFTFIKMVISYAKKAKKNGDKVYIFSGLGDMYGGGLKLTFRNLISGMIFPIFRMFGVKIIRIGRSVGPLSKALAFSERIRSKFLTRYYVRDSKSLERCKAYKIQNVDFCPDLSWCFDNGHERKINNTKTVMVNLRNSIFDDKESKFIESTLTKCDEVLSVLSKKYNGQMKVLVAYQIEEDAKFSKTVYEFLSAKYDVEYRERQIMLSEIKECYSCADFHISNRMHSLLAGYKYGSLPLALIDIENHTKISATFKDCSLPEIMLDIYKLKYSDNVDFLFENREEILNKLFEIEARFCEKISSVLNGVFN